MEAAATVPSLHVLKAREVCNVLGRPTDPWWCGYGCGACLSGRSLSPACGPWWSSFPLYFWSCLALLRFVSFLHRWMSRPLVVFLSFHSCWPAHFFSLSGIFYRWPPVMCSMCGMRRKKERRERTYFDIEISFWTSQISLTRAGDDKKKFCHAC